MKVFPVKVTHTCQWLVPTICTKKLHSFILFQLDDGSHLEYGHLVFCHLILAFKLTHTCQDWFPPFSQNISLIHFDPTWWWQPSWIPLILNWETAMVDSDTLLSSLRFTQKHSHSTLTLTQTNLIWLKLIHSHSNWWWQPSWILPCWIETLPSWIQTP